MPALTARRRAQRRRFSTSALSSRNREHGSDTASADSGLDPAGRSGSMIPTASTPNSLTFPHYLSDEEYGSHSLFLQEETRIVETDIEGSSPVQQNLFYRRRFGSGFHELTFTPRPSSADSLKKTYASLPSTPTVRDSQPFSHTRLPSADVKVKEEELEGSLHDQDLPPFSLWDYLREELLATDFDSHQELKWERVRNFLGVPLALERVR
jgi:hypothetical protein